MKVRKFNKLLKDIFSPQALLHRSLQFVIFVSLDQNLLPRANARKYVFGGWGENTNTTTTTSTNRSRSRLGQGTLNMKGLNLHL
jgi:hypothetical protein